MQTFLLILLCFLIFVWTVYGILWLCNKFLDFKLFLLKKKNAKLNYNLAKQSYEQLMRIRKLYHKSKFIDDESERNILQKELTELYNSDLEILNELSNPNADFKNFLTEEQRRDLEETLSLPRYELF